ncbi:hypothetical protein EES47_29540 [Streptomyces sp. ADI98-12]|nr:hypothetical protein EES47_29540 [Streptomyces sp. ADI98-12]
MGWQAEQFGEAHQGYAGAVLADGSDPKPVFFDTGSAANMQSSLEWWAYDGKAARPLAVGMRAHCACGWRAAQAHTISWDQVAADGVELTDTSGPAADWEQHIDAVEAEAAVVPPELVGMIDQLGAGLEDLADLKPLTALRVVAKLERLTARIGGVAARNVEADGLEDATVARSLGIPAPAARSRVARYRLGR